MASKQMFIRHFFAGGWATDFGPSSDVAPDQELFVRLPFLVDAEDVFFELDGGPHMVPGTVRLSSQLESGAAVKGLYDFWITGTTGTPTQHRIVHCGTKIKRDDADGTFSDLLTGLTSGAVPSYSLLDDLLVMVNGVDAPKSWDGSSAGSLAGSPPTAPAWVVRHQNRLFMGGDKANPSRLYYSVLLNGADWAGSGSGYIDIDPDDGDGLTGAASFKNQLILFKGPYKGSIHVLTGSSPTGSDAFARQPFVKGTGAVGQSSIFTFGDDLGWLSVDGSVRSLSVTAAYGNYREGALSRPIRQFLSDHLNVSRLRHACAVDSPDEGRVYFGLPIDGASENSAVIVMDYRFQPARWSLPRSYGSLAAALALVVDPTANNRRIVMGGGTDGYVRKFGQASRSIDGMTAIAPKVTSPFLTYALALKMKTLAGGSLGLAPKNDGSLTFGWTRDNNAQQTQAVEQLGVSDVLGTVSSNNFTLGTSTLGGASFVDRFFQAEEGGQFRSIQFQVLGGANGEDMELHSLSAAIEIGDDSYENA